MPKFATNASRKLSVAAAALLAAAGSADAAELTINSLTSLVQANPLSKSFVENFVKPVSAQCKGQIQVKYLGGPEVSPPNNAYMAVQRGQFDMLHGPASYYIGAFPEAYGMLASNITVPELHKNGGFAALDQVFQKKVGAKLVAWGEKETGYYTYLVNQPKMTADGLPDLAGLKMRASGTYRPLFEKLGASTVNMKESEIYTGLQNGIVQGFGWPVTGVPALGLHKIVKFAVKPAFYKTNTVITMNMNKWKSLTKEQRDCMDKVSRVYEVTSVEFMEKERVVDEKSLKEGGVQFVELKGDAAKKYLKIADDAIWAEFEKRSKEAPVLKSKLYKAN